MQAVYDTEKHRATESQSSLYASIARELFAYAGKIEDEQPTPPKNFEDAMSRQDWEDWCYSTDIEITGMVDMNVFKYFISLPPEMLQGT